MRASVGTAASYGCIRMLNEDVIDLYDRASVGALVIMAP
jgi:lipoprotein-anchoring transpeptidase ErfK/SrfK